MSNGQIEFASIQRIISNHFFTVVVYNALFPDRAGGAPTAGDWHVIRWSADFPAGATAIPVTRDGRIILIREMNPAFGFASWKLPTGSRKSDEDFTQCALREGKEEAGLKPTPETQVVLLGDVATDPNVIFDGVKIVLITNVEVEAGAVDRDATESIDASRPFTLVEVEDLVERGEIFDALTLIWNMPSSDPPAS